MKNHSNMFEPSIFLNTEGNRPLIGSLPRIGVADDVFRSRAVGERVLVVDSLREVTEIPAKTAANWCKEGF